MLVLDLESVQYSRQIHQDFSWSPHEKPPAALQNSLYKQLELIIQSLGLLPGENSKLGIVISDVRRLKFITLLPYRSLLSSMK